MEFDFQSDPIINLVVDWAEERPDVRAVILNSSRANPQAPVDRFSDYDIILVIRDVHPYFESRGWLEAFGRVLVLYRDPIQLVYGCEQTAFITQFEQGHKIDFILWPVEMIHQIAAQDNLPDVLDVGYAVLLDKDGQARTLKPPTFHAHLPQKPTFDEYFTEIELFFHEATYTAKHLWRDELMPAKLNLDQAMKADNLRQMLEWRIELDHGWSLKPGAYGRFLKQRLPADIWGELEATYVGSDMEENWQAMFRTIGLFRRVALQVGEALGYDYPFDLDRRMQDYLQKVRRTPRADSY
jgi:aminoglycoside 6-adenylyltransferase